MKKKTCGNCGYLDCKGFPGPINTCEGWKPFDEKEKEKLLEVNLGVGRYMTLGEMQREIIINRVDRGFPSATDLSKTTKGLKEEVNEWEIALAERDMQGQIDALGDIMVYCLGGLEILKCDASRVLTTIIRHNKIRKYKKVH